MGHKGTSGRVLIFYLFIYQFIHIWKKKKTWGEVFWFSCFLKKYIKTIVKLCNLLKCELQ